MTADHDHDTVVAIITPPGEGGIAAIRLAGRRSLSCFHKHFRTLSKDRAKMAPFMMRYGHFLDKHGAAVDEVTAVFMPAGKSYTGLDQVEIYCHGGRQVVTRILNELIASGARAAEPGEFTKLAFLSGRIDLAEAEAVAEIIGANTTTSYQVAKEHLLGAYSEHINTLRQKIIDVFSEIEASIDFPEDGVDTLDVKRLIESVNEIIGSIKELAETYTGGRIIREGYTVAIAGRPNAGKSSLFNLLLRQERALVTPTPGTTRDYLSEWIDLGGFAVKLIDTAGLREKGGPIEKAGQKSAMTIVSNADLVLWMVDLSERDWANKLGSDFPFVKKHNNLLIGNKIDIVPNYRKFVDMRKSDPRGFRPTDGSDFIPLSCLTGQGMTQLKKKIVRHISVAMPDLTAGVVVTSARHQQKLQAALKNLRRAKKKMKSGESPELTAFDLRHAATAIDEITGKVYTEDILERIFSKFCIGK